MKRERSASSDRSSGHRSHRSHSHTPSSSRSHHRRSSRRSSSLIETSTTASPVTIDSGSILVTRAIVDSNPAASVSFKDQSHASMGPPQHVHKKKRALKAVCPSSVQTMSNPCPSGFTTNSVESSALTQRDPPLQLSADSSMITQPHTDISQQSQNFQNFQNLSMASQNPVPDALLTMDP